MYFFDTYALIEIVQGNVSYRKFEHAPYVTTILNVMEMYYVLLRSWDKETALKYYELFRTACVPFNDVIIKEAMEFRLVQRKQKNFISYTDCVGYFTAMHLGLKFVSGEKHFKRLANVEYIE